MIEKRPFQKIDDLLDVSGIGQSTFNKIKDLVTLD
ncbi:MAG: helix-hairpin-helix domain-containing protein [Reichenbachiella sp.]